MSDDSRGSFSGRLGFVLATAGSAVGLGNIWRFPYLAAKYGGGIFLLIYILLAVTFGYAMIVSETSIGRMTRRSSVGAFGAFGSGLFVKFGGWISAIIPLIIVCYYTVIGGWVCKYLFEYIAGNADALAEESFFTGFVSDSVSTELWFIVFSAAAVAVVYAGVEKGVEKVSKIMMPLLVVLALIVAGYSVTRPGALEGVKYFLIPDTEHFSWMTLVAALGQMFYSLSIAMGILITYGSYMKKNVDVEKSALQIIFFDSGIAVLAGLMIIPAVFAFSGGDAEALSAGPSLMFITIPKVFASMGLGVPVGIAFFTLVLFAALTSAISLTEAGVSMFQDELGWSRKRSSAVLGAIILIFGSFSSMGFNVLDFVSLFGMSILDFADFLSNSLLMPVAGIMTCLLITRVAGINTIINEVKLSSSFRGEKLYSFVIRFAAPLFIGIILLSSLAGVFGIISL